MSNPSFKSCVIVTCFSESQPGYLDFSYRIQSLFKHYQVTILSQDVLSQPELLVHGVHYQALGRRSGKFGWLSYLWKCASVIRTLKPDLAVLLHSGAAPVSLLIGKIPSCLYWNEHPTNLNHYPENFSPVRHALAGATHWLVFLGARHANLVMPIGEEHRDDLLENGCSSERVRMIYMGVADTFSGCGVKEGDRHGKPLELIYVGTVNAPRGRDVMLEGMAEVMLARIDAHLTIVGAWEDQLSYCRTKIAQLGIERHVRVLGRVTGNEIPRLLASADIGICLWEDKLWWRFNPPTKLFEYLAAGLPVLASDIRTHKRYIEDWKNGFIFEYSAKGLARAIAELAINQEKLPKMKSIAFNSGQQYLWSKIEPDFIDAVKKVENS